MLDTLEQLKKDSIQQINAIGSIQELEQLKAHLLGKKSPLTDILKDIPSLPVEERPLVGKEANKVKDALSEQLSKAREALEQAALTASLNDSSVDVSLPAFKHRSGHAHPITLVTKEICSILARLGFSVKHGPDIESDFYNFEALNIPADHPARDMHDTFYLKSKDVLRTHTSPVQIRTMLAQKPPIKIVAPGKVYRCDADTSHSPVFHQIEGLYINDKVTFSELKYTLEFLLKELFGKNNRVRFRSSYFPFTEPSVEVDVEFNFRGKNTWLEIMGAGMVQRKVFEQTNYDPDTVSGFAFGCGIERIAMILYNIDDIRLFYENDQRFLAQF